MRIIAGSHKGRRLAPPADGTLRPTSDRLRETVFNIVAHRWPDRLHGGEIADVFAGTGAMGLEALSRGAAHSTFVEKDRDGLRLIRDNVATLGLSGQVTILKADVRALGPAARPCSLVFIDPPYGRDLAEPALESLRKGGWLQDGAVVIVEADRREDFHWPEVFEETLSRKVGNTRVHILQYTKDQA